MKRRKGILTATVLGLCVLAIAAFWGRDTAAWIEFQYRFENLGKNKQGYPEYRHRQSGIVMVRLPGGTFLMGSPETEEGRQDREGPQHKVTLSPFMIAKHEVTQAQWQSIMGDNPSHFRGKKLPVENVSWEDCKRFCKKTGLSLPSEAQWEYACRAGTTGTYSGNGNLDDMEWYKGNSESKTYPVGQKMSNDFGLHDMHGNLFERCEDEWDESFYGNPTATNKDPVYTVNSGSGDRVVRGGGWGYDARYCRSASRNMGGTSYRGSDIGFRPAWSSPFADPK